MKKTGAVIRRLVDPGLPYMGEAAGAAVASILGNFIMGPPGAMIGAAGGKSITDLFTRAGKEIDEKYISRRESAKIGAVAGFALLRIKINNEKEMSLRSDGFFISDSINDRSSADEILEGTLLAAKNEHEEKKLRYYGNFIGNIAFDSEVDRYQANFLLRIAGRLTYRQMCILAVINKKSKYTLSSDFKKWDAALNRNEKSIIREIEELKLLNVVYSTNEYMMGGGIAGNSTPQQLDLKDVGSLLYNLMNLDEIEENDLSTLVLSLSKQNESVEGT
ncbi:DUF456 domain-containing protein [Methanoregula sp. UBA64]|jgi:hypothetical protein|uniref:DUF456 domain-containing protein n=1 Tax=Methanoregula sp. UBA64 TaxID=1915554 RepID=UPI0025E69F9F|nr:DUF456 domain-containing protein [Methanoregula sp. UBA64]